MATEGILRAALATLDEQHLAVLQTTVEHILSTQLAERVFAQVAEGVPTKETSKFKPYAGMPEIQSRTQPGPEALDLVRNWRSDFSLSSLEVDSNVSVLACGPPSCTQYRTGYPSIPRGLSWLG